MANRGERSQRIAFIGTYPPRECGIATFTADVARSVASESATCIVAAVNDRPGGYDYAPSVGFTIEQNDPASYRRAAQFLNAQHVDIVSVQHEFGLFGGRAGSHVLALMAGLRAPVVTTMHTVLRDPSDEQRGVVEHLARLSDRLVVMSSRGAKLLTDIYGIPPDMIDQIPHGIPDIPFVDPSFHKDQLGVVDSFLLMTFGLLGPGKGIEMAIGALPPIVARFPQVIYLVVGATHPHVRKQQGETYRLGLRRLARDLGVEKNVIFDNRFVPAEELIEIIGAADVYLTPYVSEAQITSGTLAWAMGAGKPVVSTPYWYAQELLADERGVLVPFQNVDAMSNAVIHLIENDAHRHAMRKRAYMYAREMVWPKVAKAYLTAFARAMEMRRTRPHGRTRAAFEHGEALPEIRLDHLRRMTDDTGVLQHAYFSVPNYSEGHTTDDNARALILAVLLNELGERPTEPVESLAARYLAFLTYAFNPGNGRFRNFLGYGPRLWLDDAGSDDSHARALWALGVTVGRHGDMGLHELAVDLFGRALPGALRCDSPRAWAYALLGIGEYMHWLSGDRAAREAGAQLAGRLFALLERHRSADWCWFEDRLTYCNARLPQALLLAGRMFDEPSWERAAIESLEWLMRVQRADADHFVPIGSNGFYPRGGERALFDQQPVEACATVSACLTAFKITAQADWYTQAERAFEWYLGRNDLRLPLIDPRTGGCHDGLCPGRVNANQGAESTLSYLLSLVELKLMEQSLTLHGSSVAAREPPLETRKEPNAAATA